ncbi:Pol polyprotein [Plakobranchus ocellatus]|uniref:Pol polyprotein n=1 Tax=Plakobranchus ocellatus TaxID=259542 RepID=A0AAV4B4D0_9GAST|nr:Pol polyprotein [Plakobranchus ocellatus]
MTLTPNTCVGNACALPETVTGLTLEEVVGRPQPGKVLRSDNLILSGLNWESILDFLDDMWVSGKINEDHINNLNKVFERFRLHGPRLKQRKCSFFKKEVDGVLGRLVGKSGVQIVPESINVFTERPDGRPEV